MKKFPFIFLILIAFLNGCATSNPDSPRKLKANESVYDNSKLKSGNFFYLMPGSWQKTSPTNPMRLEEYIIDPTTQTIVAVHYFEGMSGNIDSNLERWKKQFVQDENFKELEKTQFNKDGIPVTIYHLTGTFLESENPMDPNAAKSSRPEFSMITTAVELENGTWFFKTYGPKNTIDPQRTRFDELIQTFRVED